MPALALDIQKAASNQFGEMAARRLRRNLCDMSEFASRQRDTTHQA
jgi:hypothetical protein